MIIVALLQVLRHTRLLRADCPSSSWPNIHAFSQMPCSTLPFLSNVEGYHSFSCHLGFLGINAISSRTCWTCHWGSDFTLMLSLPHNFRSCRPKHQKICYIHSGYEKNRKKDIIPITFSEKALQTRWRSRLDWSTARICECQNYWEGAL